MPAGTLDLDQYSKGHQVHTPHVASARGGAVQLQSALVDALLQATRSQFCCIP